MLVCLTYNIVMEDAKKIPESRERSTRSRSSGRQVTRLGFRLDSESRKLIERAAKLDRCKLTEYCVSTLVKAARETIEEHEALVLSARDRAAFFDALVHPPDPNERLERAFSAERRRVES